MKVWKEDWPRWPMSALPPDVGTVGVQWSPEAVRFFNMLEVDAARWDDYVRRGPRRKPRYLRKGGIRK